MPTNKRKSDLRMAAQMKTLEVARYSEDMAGEWDSFVWRSNNGTIFHTRKFLSYHPPGRFRDHSLVFLAEGRIAAVFPAAEHQDGSGRMLVSHPGASYGGFVVPLDINLRRSFDLVEALLRYARGHGFSGLEMTLPPIFYSHKINHYLDFALYRNGFTYRKREVSSFVTLDFGADEVLSTFKNEARTAVRRAQKLGVEVRESEAFADFYPILKRNLRLRHNVQPTHSLEELIHLHRLFPERIRLYGAFLGDRMIAGVVMFHTNALVTLAFYISHDQEFQRYRAVNLLFYEIIRRSIQDGFRYLDFGIFTVNMEPNWGLARFKENFGSKGIFRDTFIWHAG